MSSIVSSRRGAESSSGSIVEESSSQGFPKGPSEAPSCLTLPEAPKLALPERGTRSDRVAARLPPEVASWYRGLGAGNFSRGLIEAYHRAQVARGLNPGARETFDQGAAVAQLLSGWRARAHHGLTDSQHLSWIRARLTGRAPQFTPARARDVLDALRRIA